MQVEYSKVYLYVFLDRVFFKVYINKRFYFLFYRNSKKKFNVLSMLTATFCRVFFVIPNFDRLVNHEDTIGVDAEELVNLEVLYNLPFKYHFIKPPHHLFLFVHILLH